MVHTLIYRGTRLAGENPPFEQLATMRADPDVMLWVDLAESTDEEARKVLADVFGVHPLTIEDCLQTSPLPKAEHYDDYLYLVMHAVDYSHTEKFTTTELDLILGKNFLVTFHRQPLKPVQLARERATRNPQTQVRGPDRIAHTILDLLVDHYHPALAHVRTEVEKIEEAVLAHSNEKLESRLVETRADVTSLRQIIRPERELVGELAQGRTPFFRPKLVPYLRDLHDELIRIEEMAVAWSDQSLLLFRVYLNRASHQANQGIRVLTALMAVGIPVLIIAGWYGMNFRRLGDEAPPSSMPELVWSWSYWTVLVITVSLTGGLIWLFRKRKWF